MKRRPLMIMAGGTGGHVFPGLAVAHWLREHDVPVLWLGTRRGIEARVVPEHDIPLLFIPVTGLRGRGILRLLWKPVQLLVGLLLALLIVIRHRPCAALGMGGYVTGPGGIAMWLLRRPLLIHEQNAIPGLTNRWLARFAMTIMEAVPRAFRDRAATHTGNPVRAEIHQLPEPSLRLARREGPVRILVVGGSQGAAALNRAVPSAVAALGEGLTVAVRHQTGVASLEATRSHYQQLDIAAEIEPFIDDMAQAYAWADLVVCRSGALTIAELAAVGVASILVPFPHAVDDHQTLNAGYLVGAGAALLIPQEQLDAELAGRLRELCGSRERLLSMAKSARQVATPDATRAVGQLCLEACLG